VYISSVLCSLCSQAVFGVPAHAGPCHISTKHVVLIGVI